MSGRAARTVVTLLVTLVTALAGLAATSPPAAATGPGDDGRIAFVRDAQVFSMSRWGAGVKQLTTTGTNSHPTWSPDGRRISFIRTVGTRSDVWVMSAGGARQVAVTKSGNVTSEGATWSPDGRTLAYAADGALTRIRSTAPFGSPVTVLATPVGGFCDASTSPPETVPVASSLAWSSDGATIAVIHRSDCYFDDRFDLVDLASAQRRQYLASGADCCGYVEWSDVFWGPGNQLGYSEVDNGFDEPGHPLSIVYPGFTSLAGDTSGAPSPSGAFLALANATSGQSLVVRANADGTRRTVLAVGSQPDWQVRPR